VSKVDDLNLCENVDDAVRTTLDSLLDVIASHMGSPQSDVYSITGPMIMGVDAALRSAIENAHVKGLVCNRAVVILTTPGGYLIPVERMVNILRNHYTEVDFIIPDMAMSAGTIFALSGDRIWMDYYSILGPIDPQLERNDRLVPALSYLIQFKKLVDLANEGKLSAAHAILLQKLDLAELDQFERERELSVALLRKWLSCYKFKNWNTTRSRNLGVDEQMRQDRAEKIARILNDPDKWQTHERGINRDTLEREVDLQIDDFSTNPNLLSAIRNYHRILQDYLRRHSRVIFVHGKEYFSDGYWK
jgi:hypothetical protein